MYTCILGDEQSVNRSDLGEINAPQCIDKSDQTYGVHVRSIVSHEQLVLIDQ